MGIGEKTQSTHIQKSSLIHVRKVLIIHRWQCEHFSSAFRGQQQLYCVAISIFLAGLWRLKNHTTILKRRRWPGLKKSMREWNSISADVLLGLLTNQTKYLRRKTSETLPFSQSSSVIYIFPLRSHEIHISLAYSFYFSYESILTVVPCSMLSFLDLPSIGGERARAHTAKWAEEKSRVAQSRVVELRLNKFSFPTLLHTQFGYNCLLTYISSSAQTYISLINERNSLA